MRVILESMVKRFFALVVALAVVSAPVALEICQITCESNAMAASIPHADSHAGHHHMPADHASCHEHGDAPQLLPGSVPCDHGVEATPSLVAAKTAAAAVSLVAVLPLRQAIGIVTTHDFVFVRQSAWSGRLAVPLVIPLRV
jgi:hypothetical protein